MIDLHSHLLPGVDDGSRSIEMTLPVLERFARRGIDIVVCTPHLLASDVHRIAPEYHRAAFDDLVRHAPEKPQLRLGFEIMLDKPGVDLRAPHLHLGGSTAALVEFSCANLPPHAAEELGRIRASGVVPVLAHPERYWGCTPAHVERWRRVGAVIQMDAAMLLGRGDGARLAKALLEQGLVDCIASDNHGDRRSLAAARDWLLEIGAAEQADLLTQTNAARLLEDHPVLPVSPLSSLNTGVLGRLRELLFWCR